MGENGDFMGEKNNGILEKTSPNSPFIIHHSSFIIHHFLYLHFFKRLNSYKVENSFFRPLFRASTPHCFGLGADAAGNERS